MVGLFLGKVEVFWDPACNFVETTLSPSGLFCGIGEDLYQVLFLCDQRNATASVPQTNATASIPPRA